MKKYLWIGYLLVLVFVAFHAAGLDSYKLVPKNEVVKAENTKMVSIVLKEKNSDYSHF